MCFPVLGDCCVLQPSLESKKPRKVTVAEISKVQACIETCLQQFMSKTQTMAALEQVGVDHRFTSLVWDRLEAENAEWFQSYYAQLHNTACAHNGSNPAC